MPLLHINLTNEKQEVDIGRDIKAQSMILRKIVVVRDALASEDVDNSELGSGSTSIRPSICFVRMAREYDLSLLVFCFLSRIS